MAVVPLKIGMLTRIIVGVEEDIERNLEPVLDLFRVGIEGDIGRDHAEYRGDAVAAARLIGFGRARDHHVAAIEANLFFGLAQRRVDRVAVARIDLAAGKSRSAEHTSELQALMRITNSVFCLQKNTNQKTT